MATIADVARLAGVSKATASRALSGSPQVSVSTRDAVARAARELGYRASRAAVNLAKGRTQSIAILAPAADRWYFASIIAGIADAARAHDHDVVLYDLDKSAEDGHAVFAQFLGRTDVDGVVSCTVNLEARDVSQLREHGIPAAMVGGRRDGIRTFNLDDEEAGRLLGRHIVELGHRDVVFVGAESAGPLRSNASPDRERGVATALAAAGAPRLRTAIVPPDAARAHEAALEILRGDQQPTAYVAATDEIAIGFLLAARDIGLRVPDDVSIVGVDDHPMSTPFGLTTVRQEPKQQGRAVVEWLLSGPGDDVSHTAFEPELVIRTSAARPAPGRDRAHPHP